MWLPLAVMAKTAIRSRLGSWQKLPIAFVNWQPFGKSSTK
jgi:hypothetical protein